MAATITPIAAETRNFIQAAEPWIGEITRAGVEKREEMVVAYTETPANDENRHKAKAEEEEEEVRNNNEKMGETVGSRRQQQQSLLAGRQHLVVGYIS